MSDEQKINGTPNEPVIPDETPVTPEKPEETPENSDLTATEQNEGATDSDEMLNDELESLRSTFQETYNAEIAAGEPVIQELETEVEPDDTVYGENDETPAAEAQEAPVKKPKKKHTKAIVITIVLVLVFLLIVAPLGGYFILTIKEPNTTQLLSNLVSASSADTAADAVTYYTAALEYCKDDSIYASMKQEILEKIVVSTSKSTGYADAKTYMESNMTEEMTAAPKTSEFKEFLKVGDSIGEVADKAYDAVKTAVDALKEGEEIDSSAVATAIGTPSFVNSEVKTALENIAKALTAEKTAKTEAEVQAFVEEYLAAYETFKGMGADCQLLLEKTAVAVYNSGFAYEAKLIESNYLTEEMLAAPKTAEFTAMNTELEAISSYKEDLYLLAEENKDAAEDFDFSTLIVAELSNSIKKSIGTVISNISKAIVYENDNNLTKAVSYYSQALNAASSLGLATDSIALKAAKLQLMLGDTSTAAASAKLVSKAALEAADDADKKIFEDISAADAAQSAADEVFYPYYMYYANYGQAIDKAKANSELDAILTESSTNFDKAFVAFYKYYVENFTDGDKDTMHTLLLECSDLIPKYPCFYGYSLIESYKTRGEYTNAIELAKQILETNSSDDYANSVLALSYRMKNDVDAALTTALYGIENSGATCYSGYEAAVAYTIKGDYQNAFAIVKTLFDEGLTVNVCNLVKLIEVLYDGTDEALKADITEFSGQVDTLFSNYSYTVSADIGAVKAKTKTVTDIFTTGTYDFAD